MIKNRWFKFFPSDFLTGIRNLNPIEVTAYVIVLCELYDHEGTCRRDDAHMSRVCRIRGGDFTRAVDALIAKGKVDSYAGMLTNKRVSEEVQRRVVAAEDKARQRRDGDMAATQPRHEQVKNTNKNNAKNIDVRSYIEEERKKESTSSEVYALPSREGLTPAEKAQKALEDYKKRNPRRQGRTSH